MEGAALVFRIEDQNAYGPYRGDSMLLLDGHNNDVRGHPTRWNDEGLRRFCEDWNATRFGFESMRKLFEWFTGHELHALFELGFKVSIYRVPGDRVKHGDKQTLFDAEYATRLKSFQFRPLKGGQRVQPLDELF